MSSPCSKIHRRYDLGQTDSGMSFTAVIKEISQYPDSDGASYIGDSQNNVTSIIRFML